LDGCVRTIRCLIGPEVVLDLHAEPDSVQGDPAELEQVLLDVCLCAYGSPIKGGTLTLSTDNVVRVLGAEPADLPEVMWVRLVVSDSASAGDHLAQTRACDVDALPMARAIIAQYGGTLVARSSPECGTTVSVCLPCAASARA
jgi:hypothetical protein